MRDWVWERTSLLRPASGGQRGPRTCAITAPPSRSLVRPTSLMSLRRENGGSRSARRRGGVFSWTPRLFRGAVVRATRLGVGHGLCPAPPSLTRVSQPHSPDSALHCVRSLSRLGGVLSIAGVWARTHTPYTPATT
eukprot:6405923-Prymnesium_polylepis.1